MADPTNPLAPVTRTGPIACDSEGMGLEPRKSRNESGNYVGLYRRDAMVSPAKYKRISCLSWQRVPYLTSVQC
jgi:hypothetical protein